MILYSIIIFVCFSLRFHFGDIVVIHCHNLLCDADCPVFIIIKPIQINVRLCVVTLRIELCVCQLTDKFRPAVTLRVTSECQSFFIT